jgi:hypothetical protein
MATNSFANAGLDMFGTEGQQGNGLLGLGAAYLADKAGLIDLKNAGQRKAFEQGGFKGVAAHQLLNKMAPVPPPILGGQGAATGADMDAAYAPEGMEPPVQGSAAPTDMEDQYASEDIDSHLPQFLSLFGMA